MFIPEESSEIGHSRFDLESDAISQWLSWVGVTGLINIPGLVKTIMARPVDDMSVVGVGITVNIEAHLAGAKSNILSVGISPQDLLSVLSLVLSYNNHDTTGQSASISSRESVASSGPGSNGLGSPVKGPPLFVVHWVVVLDSHSVLVSTNMFFMEESSVSTHS